MELLLLRKASHWRFTAETQRLEGESTFSRLKIPFAKFYCQVSAFRVNDRKSLSASFAPKPDKQRKLRVLSLYDGIGAGSRLNSFNATFKHNSLTGFYVLENLKVDVEAYYACELDEDAINLAKPRLEDRVTHLGDLKALDATTIKNILPIDLLLGGPPCSNSPSSAHTRRKGLYGRRSRKRFSWDVTMLTLQILAEPARFSSNSSGSLCYCGPPWRTSRSSG